jgi:osmotically-inducible protein OsmY
LPSDIELERAAEIALAPLVEVNIGVLVRDGLVYLSGAVSFQAQRAEAERLVSSVPGIRGVINQITIDEAGYESSSHIEEVSEAEVIDKLQLEGVELTEDPDAEPDLSGDVGTTDVTMLGDNAGPDYISVPFFPPTDPVVRNADREDSGMKVVGGWARTSMTKPTQPSDDEDQFGLGDYEVQENVIYALRSDAATQDLEIRVSVKDGVVHLHGVVSSLDDAENAEEVAARVDGVQEVVEALSIEEPYIR